MTTDTQQEQTQPETETPEAQTPSQPQATQEPQAEPKPKESGHNIDKALMIQQQRLSETQKELKETRKQIEELRDSQAKRDAELELKALDASVPTLSDEDLADPKKVEQRIQAERKRYDKLLEMERERVKGLQQQQATPPQPHQTRDQMVGRVKELFPDMADNAEKLFDVGSRKLIDWQQRHQDASSQEIDERAHEIFELEAAKMRVANLGKTESSKDDTPAVSTKVTTEGASPATSLNRKPNQFRDSRELMRDLVKRGAYNVPKVNE